MRKKIYFIILLITTIPYLAPAEEPVYFADANLKAVVEETLGITDPTPTDMLKLTDLSAHDRGISDLTGLECAANLQKLEIEWHQISDLWPLSGLTSLEYLSLENNQIGGNQISDISPLSGLMNLQYLCLDYNQIRDISPLSGLMSLRELSLYNNQIRDISPLSGLTTSLRELYLGDNQISNISVVAGLPNLVKLGLGDNEISNISVVAGLPNLVWLGLGDNQISDISPLSELTNLETLYLYRNQISDISLLSRLTNLQYLSLLNNQISDISPLSELTNLQYLFLYNNQISDISSLSGLTSLKHLTLYNNQISDISALSGLLSLQWLDLHNNQISDISSLAELKNLDYLNLQNNSLNQDYCYIYIQQIRENNPGIDLHYDDCLPLPTIIYVDDDAPGDPGAGDPQISDVDEDGSPEHPFDTIQEAIDLAEDGDTVTVYPGIYQEEINFLGKKLTVQGVVASPAGVPVLQNPGDFAVSFYSGEGPDSLLKNFIIKDSFMGVFIAGCSPTISNLTIVNNKYGIEAYAVSEPVITNCILWNNSDDNLFQCRARYSCIERAGEGEGNITFDPLFVDPDSDDYHLRSERGRYWPEHDIWVLDKVTSPCIDAGDPLVDPSNEPLPNGGRINMGAYGGTACASMSDSPLIGDLLPPEVVEKVFGITGGFHFNSSWFIAKFYNGSEYTITQVTINIRLTDRITGQQQWYEVVLGPLGAIILPGQTEILSADVGVTKEGKDFYWEIIDMTGYLN